MISARQAISGAEGDAAAALGAWLGVTAPGMLITRGLVLGGMIVIPRWTSSVYVAPRTQLIAAVLLALHATGAVLLMRNAVSLRLRVVVGIAGCAADAVACGLIIGADGQLRGPGGALAAVVVGLNVAARGWRGLVLSALALTAGAATAIQGSISPVVAAVPRLSFATILSVDIAYYGAPAVRAASMPTTTTLSVETAFPGAPRQSAEPASFPTTLSVETALGGSAAPANVRSALFLPVLAGGMAALCVGAACNLMRVRRTRTAVAAQMLAASRGVQ